MNVLLQDVLDLIDGPLVQQLAGRLGVSPAQAQANIAQALPGLLHALGQHAGTPAGAEAIRTAVQQLTAGGSGAINVDGLIGQIMASHPGGAAGLADATGVPQSDLAHLLPVLAPSILAALSRQGPQGAGAAPDLAQALGTAAQHAQGAASAGGIGGLFGALLGRL